MCCENSSFFFFFYTLFPFFFSFSLDPSLSISPTYPYVLTVKSKLVWNILINLQSELGASILFLFLFF